MEVLYSLVVSIISLYIIIKYFFFEFFPKIIFIFYIAVRYGRSVESPDVTGLSAVSVGTVGTVGTVGRSVGRTREPLWFSLTLLLGSGVK